MSAAAKRTRKLWGWGIEEADLTQEERSALVRSMEQRSNLSGLEPAAPPRLEDIALPEPRIKPPDALAAICSTDKFERAGHTYGKAFRDVVRALAGDFSNAPDLVAFPKNEQDVTDLLDWCGGGKIAAIPYGGGSSVVAGVEADVGEAYAGAVSIDMKHFGKVLEVDTVSRAAHIEAGIY